MAMRQADPAGVPSALARWLRIFHSTLMWLLIVCVALILTPLVLTAVQSQSSLFEAYNLQIHLLMTLVGICEASLGVVRLAFDDLGMPIPGMRPTDTSWRLGYLAIIVGFASCGYGLFPLVASPGQTDIATGVFFGVGFLASMAIVLRRLFPRRERDIGDLDLGEPEGEDVENMTPAAASPARISRRTVLMGLGVLGLGSVGIGWLIRSLPTVLPRFTYRGHGERIQAIAWSPDGRRIASSDEGSSVQIWDALTGNAAAHVSIPHTVPQASPGRRTAATSLWVQTMEQRASWTARPARPS